MQGQSLLSETREAVFIQYDHQKNNPGIGIGPRVHTLRMDNWRFSVFDNVAWGELYDLESDPGEFNNLWDDEKYRDIRFQLTEHLLRAGIAAVDRAPFPLSLA